MIKMFCSDHCERRTKSASAHLTQRKRLCFISSLQHTAEGTIGSEHDSIAMKNNRQDG